MKKTKFTEEQILFALKQGDAGVAVADVILPATSGHLSKRLVWPQTLLG